jgi:hypothetical protein
MKHTVGSSSGWTMGYRPTALQMVGTHMSSVSITSPLIQHFSCRDIVPCTAGFLICAKTCLFNSVKLAHAAYLLFKPVLVHGILKRSGHGCPRCVIQEAKVGGGAEATRRMMKAVGLKGDSMLSDLVVKSWYDQKLFLHDLIKVQEGIARSHHEECLVIKLQPNDRLYFPLLVPIP